VAIGTTKAIRDNERRRAHGLKEQTAVLTVAEERDGRGFKAALESRGMVEGELTGANSLGSVDGGSVVFVHHVVAITAKRS